MAEVNSLQFRVEPQIKTSLEKASQEDHRPVSSLIEKTLPEWLRAEVLLRREASS